MQVTITIDTQTETWELPEWKLLELKEWLAQNADLVEDTEEET